MAHANRRSEDWKKLPWKQFQRNVFRLQKRIYQATRRGDFKRARSLQRLLLHSWSARCLAVRQVSQDNRGNAGARPELMGSHHLPKDNGLLMPGGYKTCLTKQTLSAGSTSRNRQTEYRGVVQYYRLAYNMHQLGSLKWVMQQSLVRTLSKKLIISKAQVYRRFKTTHRNEFGTYKVLEATLKREAGQPPLVARFGGMPLRYNKWVSINDAPTAPIWSGRSELVERLLAQECELCGATNNIEVHHIRKLADLERYGQTNLPQWVRQMATRRRKTLVVCRSCHHDIQYGRYDGPKLST